jgi:hypothetical protein
MKRKFFVGLLLVCAFVFGLQAQDAPTLKVTESDYAVFANLRYANTLSRTRLSFAHSDDAKKAFAEKELQKAYEEAGWTPERYQEVNDALMAVPQFITSLDSGDPEEVSWAKESLSAMDPATVATSKAHARELNDSSALETKAMAEMQNDVLREKRGDIPTAAQIQGHWVADLEATAKLNADGLGADFEKKMLDSLKKNVYSASYTFGPGNKVETVTHQANGKTQTDKTTFRIADDKIWFKAGSSEVSLEIGLKDGVLRIGMMGVYTLFNKAK